MVSDRAITCPTCGYVFKPDQVADTSPSDPPQVPPEPAEPVTSHSSTTDMNTPQISRGRHVLGIVLNVLIGGVGWLLAPKWEKLPGLLFFVLWIGTGFMEGELRTLAIAAVNISSAWIFGANFNRYVR